MSLYSPEVNGINWPSEISYVMSSNLIVKSRKKSLRSLVARHIELEAAELWKQYESFSPNQGERNPRDLAIREGYYQVGHELLYADTSIQDGDGSALSSVRAIEITSGSLDMGVKSALLNDFCDYRKEVIISFAIDPTGLDLLAWRRLLTENIYGKHDPGIFGFTKGIERYSDLYYYLVNAGAIPDEGAPFFKRSLLKGQRAIETSSVANLMRAFLGR